MSKKSEDGPDISSEERARITKASRQLISYANFLRWSANFKRDEILKHPNHDRVVMLSAMQSGRFSFAIDGDTLLLGVQDFESVWMVSMPFDTAYISDRLYLAVEGVACMDANLPSLALGIFVDDVRKRAEMKKCKYLQLVSVKVMDGRVSEVGRAFGLGFPLSDGDVVKQLIQAERNRAKQMDIGRYF